MHGYRLDPAETGLCMAVFYLVPSSRVKGLLPPKVSVIEVIPGMTLGGLYAARFPQADGAALNEFGLMQAYVRYESKKGYFLDHFCADNSGAAPAGMIHDGPSCSGSDFKWDFTGKTVSLSVRSESETAIEVRMTPLLKRLPISSCFHFLCLKGENVLVFKNRLASSIGISMTKVSIPEGSPLSGIPLKYKLLSTYWEPSNVIMKEPESVKPRSAIGRTDEAFGSHMSCVGTVKKQEAELCHR